MLIAQLIYQQFHTYTFEEIYNNANALYCNSRVVEYMYHDFFNVRPFSSDIRNALLKKLNRKEKRSKKTFAVYRYEKISFFTTLDEFPSK